MAKIKQFEASTKIVVAYKKNEHVIIKCCFTCTGPCLEAASSNSLFSPASLNTCAIPVETPAWF